MKTLFAILLALASPVGALADTWQESVHLWLDANTLILSSDAASTKAVSRVMLTPGGSVLLTVTGLPTVSGDISVVITRTKADGTETSPAIEYKTSGDKPAIPADEDGYLKIVRKTGNDTSSPNRLRLVVARPVTLFGTLNAGAIFTSQHRKTFSLSNAFDASGNPIPSHSIIVENRNDTSISSTVGGKFYYVFGEHQRSGLIRALQTVLSLDLHREGYTRFGLFLGIAGTSGQPNSYQLGFSFFPDREMNLAFSLGANFAEGEELAGGFKAGDIVSLSNLDNVTRKKWTAGFFFSITFNAPTTSK